MSTRSVCARTRGCGAVQRRALDLSDRTGVALVGERSADGAAAVRAAIETGDNIVLRGDPEAVGALASDLSLGLREEAITRDRVENTLFNPRVRAGRGGDPAPLAVDRQALLSWHGQGERRSHRARDPAPGADIAHDSTLAAGDTLLLQGTWNALDSRLNKAEVLVVDSPDLVRRQAVPMRVGARTMLAIMAGMVVLLATGIVPAAVAGPLAACAVVLLGVLSVEQMYRAIN